MNFKKTAFTLAEVLITLAVIGIVAVLTIPSFISRHNERALETQKLKTKAVLTNAFKMLMAEEATTDLNTSTIISCEDKSCYARELKKVLKVLSEVNMNSENAKMKYSFDNGEKAVWSEDKVYTFIGGDGVIYGVEKTEDNSVSFVVDLNGFKSPNKGGKDLCRYTVSTSGQVIETCASMLSFAEASKPSTPSKPMYGECIEPNSYADKCNVCENGYYPDGSYCVSCESKGCSECNSMTGACTSCLTGYYLSSQACVSCGHGIPNCAVCADGNSCTTCSKGYILSDGKCVKE